MNLKEKSSIEKWKVYLTILVAVTSLLGFMLKTLYGAFTVENRMFDSETQKTQLIYDVKVNKSHATDIDVHMPYEKKVEKFVTRPEYNTAIKIIGETLKEIKEDVKYIRRNR